MRGWAVPSPEKQKSRRSPSLALINYRSHLNVIVHQLEILPKFLLLNSLPPPHFALFEVVHVGRRPCARETRLPFFANLFFRSSSSVFLLVPPARDRARKRRRRRALDVHPPPRHLTRVLACRSSPCAFAPYAARYASSASPCRRNGDTETGAPCRTPTSDDSSDYSSACRPCRRPGS